MKLTLDLNGQSTEIEFTVADGAAQLTVGDRRHEALIGEPEPGLFTVILNDRVYRCALERLPNGATEIAVNGTRIPVVVRDRKHRRANEAAGAAGGRAVLTAPMPGKVVRILCAVGDEVAAQQGLLVVEAMKMQNEVQSPKAGQVVELRVVEGQTVNAGEVLAVVE